VKFAIQFLSTGLSQQTTSPAVNFPIHLGANPTNMPAFALSGSWSFYKTTGIIFPFRWGV